MKNWVFQLHWLLGITAGLVLAVVGGTGALMSFEKQIMEAISPGIASVEVRDDVALLQPDALLARFRSDHPGAWVEQITLSEEAGRSAAVRVASEDKKARAQTLYINPYTGETLGTMNGQAFFRSVLELHRWLLVPNGEGTNIGRQITGFSAIALVYFALSGLYLRWPRRPLDWRNWFRIDFSLKGRSFYWALHSVVGTWVLIVYLLLALTGLSWSYSWYRSGLSVVLTGEAPKERRERGERGGRGEEQELPQTAPATDVAWQAFLTKTEGHYKTASISIPKKAREPFSISYILPEALHERQRSSMSVNAAGEITKFQPYTPVEPLGKRIYQSMYELHTGDWFGTPGRIVNMVASLLMPLFTITGFLLYLDRRKKKRHTRKASTALTNMAHTQATPDYLVVYASQSGTSEKLAWHTANILNSGGVSASVKSLTDINHETLTSTQKILFLLSTFGEGEAPDMARGFIKNCMKSAAALDNLRFGLLALGDKCYRDYCGFAIDVEQWLLSNGASSIFERINVDNNDESAIQQWEKEIAKLGGVTTIAQRQVTGYSQWTLSSRHELNPGSVGNAIYSVNLLPVKANTETWQAGDILEIKPQHDPAKIEAFLIENQLDGNHIVNGLTLRELLATHTFPTRQQLQTGDLQALSSILKPLAKREYSIASIPADGNVELVIRQAFDENGHIGLGSGWLTRFAKEGEPVYACIRPNPAFHSQDHNGPIIFIGAGTGIAGLRSHLHARQQAGATQNWLIFGERHRAHDRLYGDEFDNWINTGVLQKLDEVFSRDTNAYVQDRLIEEQALVRDWVAGNGAVFICGSLTGMAVGVEQALIQILGQKDFESLCESGRYRRDVY